MFPVLHGIFGYLGMHFPVSGNIHEINVIPVAKLHPGTFGAIIFRSFRPAEPFEDSGCPFHPVLLHIAQGHYLRAVYLAHPFHCSGTAHSESDEAYPHRIKRRGGIKEHVSLSGRTFRHFSSDDGGSGSSGT